MSRSIYAYNDNEAKTSAKDVANIPIEADDDSEAPLS